MSRSIAPALALAGALVIQAPAALAEGCPEARTQRLAAHFPDAEAAARKCIDEAPEDVGAWIELSRALGLQGDFSAAIDWAERGLDRYPDDVDIALWHVRLLAWSGRLDAARSGLDMVVKRVPDVLQDRETAMLAADISYWSHDWSAAHDGFNRYLESWPDDVDAKTKKQIVLNEMEREAARIDVSVEPTFATGGGPDELTLRVSALARTWDALGLGLAADFHTRDVQGDAVSIFGLAHWGGDGVAVDASIGGRITGADYEAEMNAFVEPTVRLASHLWASLRYWRLGFADGGAHIIDPAITVPIGDVELEARYWLGLEDAGRVTHAGLFRTRWSPSEAWTFELGGGAGTASDYLAPRNGGEGHWVAVGGVRWQPSWRHRLSANYVQRHEKADGAYDTRHEVTIAWSMSL